MDVQTNLLTSLPAIPARGIRQLLVGHRSSPTPGNETLC